jgi:UDP-2,3-diacylglucosamine pyrophosphatase LpxH
LEKTWRDARSLFISDTHIGWCHSKSAQLLKCIRETQPEFLYLVGDILEQKYPTHSSGRQTEVLILNQLMDLRSNGTVIVRITGNHDEPGSDEWDAALGPSLPHVVHSSADGQKWLVVHGDIFDMHQGLHKSWSCRLGGSIYPYLIGLASAASRVGLSNNHKPSHWCTRFKLSLCRVRRYIRRYERYMVRLAEWQGCHGVICGHIHLPSVKTIRRKTYANCGDWIEHQSFLIETASGEVSLFNARS